MKSPSWKNIFMKAILPFMIASTGFFVFYSFINWAFIIKLKLIEPRSDVVGFFVPAAISGLIVLFYLKKKLLIFKLNDRACYIILFLSWIALLLPVMMAQIYLERQCGKLTILTNADQILKRETSKYYSIKKAIPKKKFTGLFVKQYSVDKGNEKGVGCYFACPLSDFVNLDGSNNIWIGVCFSNKYSNRVFDDKVEQRRLIKAFIDSSLIKYQTYNYSINYLEKQHLNDSDDFISAIDQTHLKYDADKLIILTEPQGDYEGRTKGTGTIALISFAVANLFWIITCVISYWESFTK